MERWKSDRPGPNDLSLLGVKLNLPCLEDVNVSRQIYSYSSMHHKVLVYPYFFLLTLYDPTL